MLESSLNDINQEEIELDAANLHEISKKKHILLLYHILVQSVCLYVCMSVCMYVCMS